MKVRKPGTGGFTLIELMIVVVIIGVLAAMAIPRWMAATTKTKQSEAKLILKQIYVNQRTYRQQSLANTYFIPAGPASAATPNAFGEIWVEIMSDSKYTYTMNATPTTFIVTATANIDDDAAIDTWTMDDIGVITNTIDDSNT
ncbi:MAG: type IV pilin protein [Candidatus Zixiibacteriota bacterium]